MKYLKFGDSKNFVVFLHGWGASKESFLWTKNYFKDFSLIYLDFEGFGESECPPKAYCVGDYVCSVKALLDNYEIESLVLVGHSFGGRVAIKFARQFESLYHDFKLVLVDSAGMKPRRSLKFYVNVFKYKVCKKMAKKSKHFENKLKKYGSCDFKNAAGVMRETFVKVVNENLESSAKQIRSKTLIIWGENDLDTKLFMAKKLKRLIKNSKLEIIKGAGHFSFLDKPLEFVILLDSFIKNK